MLLIKTTPNVEKRCKCHKTAHYRKAQQIQKKTKEVFLEDPCVEYDFGTLVVATDVTHRSASLFMSWTKMLQSAPITCAQKAKTHRKVI